MGSVTGLERISRPAAMTMFVMTAAPGRDKDSASTQQRPLPRVEVVSSGETHGRATFGADVVNGDEINFAKAMLHDRTVRLERNGVSGIAEPGNKVRGVWVVLS